MKNFRFDVLEITKIHICYLNDKKFSMGVINKLRHPQGISNIKKIFLVFCLIVSLCSVIFLSSFFTSASNLPFSDNLESGSLSTNSWGVRSAAITSSNPYAGNYAVIANCNDAKAHTIQKNIVNKRPYFSLQFRFLTSYIPTNSDYFSFSSIADCQPSPNYDIVHLFLRYDGWFLVYNNGINYVDADNYVNPVGMPSANTYYYINCTVTNTRILFQVDNVTIFNISVDYSGKVMQGFDLGIANTSHNMFTEFDNIAVDNKISIVVTPSHV